MRVTEPATGGRRRVRFLVPNVIRFARALALSGLAAAGAAYGINIPEGTSKLALANEITKSYVIPLQLRGKSADEAIAIMLSEGFRCGIEHDEGRSNLNRSPVASRCLQVSVSCVTNSS